MPSTGSAVDLWGKEWKWAHYPECDLCLQMVT
jgi:hypothetical protein